ncbi:MAG: efflux RND transporter periplasmic adaptor subunit [Rhodoferax sp.]
MPLKTFPVALTLVSAALLLSACSKPVPPEEPIRAVRVVAVGAGTIQSIVEFAGEVRPRVESRLGFRVAGKLVRRQAELGQRVSAGQVLAQIDPQDYKLAAEASQAQVSVARTNRDLAAEDYKRYKDLRDQNFISSAELERRDATLKAAQAQLVQAQAQFASQGNQQSYTTLVADVAGVVTSVDAEPGQVVAAGTPVVRIAQDGARDAVFSVPEDKISMIKVGSEVDVKGWATSTVLKGTVREVAASTDPVTRTFAVKVGLDAATSPQLGTTVTVVPKSLEKTGVSVIKLPTSAFIKDGSKSSVWVLDTQTMTVHLQPVQIATADGNDVVVVQGLAPGMLVVTAGVHVLSPNQKVSVYKEPVSTAASAPVASDSAVDVNNAVPAK